MVTSEERKMNQLVLTLGSKYAYNEKHAHFVEKAALKLFDSLKKIHKLGHTERIILSHASLLHDVGNFISEKRHNKHTKYIIDHDASMDDYPEGQRGLLSLVAYNHRKKLHKDTLKLPKAERDMALKLSALLRVADSLYYNGDEVLIKSIAIEGTGISIVVEGALPERLRGRLLAKKDLFVDVFKMDVSLHI